MDEEAIKGALDKAVVEVKEMTAKMQKSVDDVKNEFGEKVKGFASVEDVEKIKALSGDLESIKAEVGRIKVGSDRRELDPKKGYKSPSDFLSDVMASGKGLKPTDRLQMCKAVGSDEASTSSNPLGGFLLPAALLGDVLTSNPFELQADTGIMTRQIPMSAQVVHINARVDRDHSSSVTGGLVVYRRSEMNSVDASKTTFEQIKLEAEPLTGASFATEELLAASPISFTTLIAAGFSDEFRSKLNDERIRGDGIGRYLGILNSPALITVAKETSQTATTIVGANIRKMRARCWRYGNAVWMINQDCYDAVCNAHVAGTNTDKYIYDEEKNLLLGRPVIWDENMSTLGTLGDIVLANWSEYLEGSFGGSTFQESIHVRFLNNERCFKFNTMNAGQPWWRTALTPKHSTVTLSPFVALAARG